MEIKVNFAKCLFIEKMNLENSIRYIYLYMYDFFDAEAKDIVPKNLTGVYETHHTHIRLFDNKQPNNDAFGN